MQIINLETHDIDIKALKKRNADAQDFDTLIDTPTIGKLDGKTYCVYGHIEGDTTELLGALHDVEYKKDWRTNGMFSQSRIFGYRPREPLRKDFCGVSSLARDNPDVHDILCKWACKADGLYTQAAPEQHSLHKSLVRGIRDEYVMHDTVFTSGIANKDNPLAYHFDGGNFKGAWNVMFVFPHNVTGGHTVLPAHRVAFAFRKPSYMVFPAQECLHGVMPINAMPGGYRYSLVYYALKGMTKCLCRDGELARIRKVKSEREDKRRRKRRA